MENGNYCEIYCVSGKVVKTSVKGEKGRDSLVEALELLGEKVGYSVFEHNGEPMSKEHLRTIIAQFKNEWKCKYVGDTPITHPDVPDYPNDLNAMASLWNYLCRHVDKSEELEAESLRVSYGEQLERIANRQIVEHGGTLSYVLANLTAYQKAEAFVRAIGRWVHIPVKENN